MTCPKCGTTNTEESTFCIKCGTNLKETQPEPSNEQLTENNQSQPEQNNNIQENQSQPEQNTTTEQTETKENTQVQQQNQNNEQQKTVNNNSNVNKASLNYIMYIVAILLKPFKSFREEESKLNDPKTSFILTLMISGAMTIINLIKTILLTVHVPSYSFSEGYSYSWQWDNIKNIKWIEVIGKNFLIYTGIIFAIAIVFYLGSLVIKKQISFIKTLSISASSMIPAVLGIMVISPIAGKIWVHLSVIFMIVGAVYSFVIFYELMNDELKLEGDTKVYFNLVCLGILAIAGYYAYMKLFIPQITTGLDQLTDYFK